MEHYSKLPSYRAYEGKLEDITLEKMTFRCNGSSFEIPFKPLMQSYRDARERVVEMDKECLSALDKSEITVKEYIPPTGFHALGSLAVIATLIGFSTRIWFAPGGQVDRISPGFASFCFTVQPVLITLGLAIHSAEMIYMIRGRLRRHSVNVRTSLWWKWALGTFIEGFGSDLRCVLSISL